MNEQKLQKYIETLIQEIMNEDELEEESISGDVGAYSTPNAFSKNKDCGCNGASEEAEREGWKKVKIPSRSKIVDYKKIFQESDYDKASPSSNPSLYSQASPYTGIGGDNHPNGYYKESLTEVSYNQFKKNISFRSKNEMLHKAIKEVKRKLQEIDSIVEYTSRVKQELSENEDGLQQWKKSEKVIHEIHEMVANLNEKINGVRK